MITRARVLVPILFSLIYLIYLSLLSKRHLKETGRLSISCITNRVPCLQRMKIMARVSSTQKVFLSRSLAVSCSISHGTGGPQLGRKTEAKKCRFQGIEISMGSSTNFVVLDLLDLLASFKQALLKRGKSIKQIQYSKFGTRTPATVLEMRIVRRRH